MYFKSLSVQVTDFYGEFSCIAMMFNCHLFYFQVGLIERCGNLRDFTGVKAKWGQSKESNIPNTRDPRWSLSTMQTPPEFITQTM